jgi:ribose 5-phosphate isomerase B
MNIYLATDHAGFELKEVVKKFLTEKGHAVKDLGAFQYDKNDDYPDYVKIAAEAVSKCAQGSHPEHSEGSRDSSSANWRTQNDKCVAIVFGGSGQGEAMVANRYKGVRATVVYKFDRAIIKLSREHNNANVLSIGARFLGERKALKAVELWLATPFSGEERHQRRINKFQQ